MRCVGSVGGFWYAECVNVDVFLLIWGLVLNNFGIVLLEFRKIVWSTSDYQPWFNFRLLCEHIAIYFPRKLGLHVRLQRRIFENNSFWPNQV
jgi:hypothetical protein